jgi:hypothetical protein
MGSPSISSIEQILCNTLKRLAESSEFRQDDPAVNELKRHIVRSIAELEVAKSSQADSNDHEYAPLAPKR